MTFKTFAVAAVVLSSLALSAAHAQNTRAEVKADARANAANQPTGEISSPAQVKGPMAQPPSSTTREAVKADARATRGTGATPMGENSATMRGERPSSRNVSSNTRAQVKAEAGASRKSGVKARGESSEREMNKGEKKP